MVIVPPLTGMLWGLNRTMHALKYIAQICLGSEHYMLTITIITVLVLPNYFMDHTTDLDTLSPSLYHR